MDLTEKKENFLPPYCLKFQPMHTAHDAMIKRRNIRPFFTFDIFSFCVISYYWWIKSI